MPEVGTFSRETEIGTKLLKRPKSRGGKGLVKITTFIGDGGEKTVTFRINTSLDDIDEREKILRAEIEERREMYRKRRDG